MINGRTKLVGIIGNPIEETLSPIMHNAAFHHLNLNWCYVPFLVDGEALEGAVAAVRVLKLVGINVTMPFKAGVIDFLDEVDAETKEVQAVNTIVRRDGRLVGSNTDGGGFIRSLEQDAKRKARDAKVFILGCGGAARAIAYDLAKEGAARLAIVNRTLEKAAAFGAVLERRFPELEVAVRSFGQEFYFLLEDADIVMNATPMGKVDLNGIPDIVGKLGRHQLVCDLNSSPAVTAFLKAAQSRGCPTLGGRSMLVFQGALSFKIWTGQDAPIEVMKKAIEDAGS